MSIDDLIRKCDAENITLTAQRKIVLEIIAESDDHPDVNTLFQRAFERDSSISLATVYRALSLLETHNIISKLDIGDGKARYEELNEHHDHLIDMDSGDIYEFHDEELEKLKETIAKKLGFELVGHRLELYGSRKK